jgi:hypothetical protein
MRASGCTRSNGYGPHMRRQSPDWTTLRPFNGWANVRISDTDLNLKKLRYLSSTHTGSSDKPTTIVIPLNSSDAFPGFSSGELVNNQDLQRMPGVRALDLPHVFPGPDTSTYAFWQINTQRNLYRIGLP